MSKKLFKRLIKKTSRPVPKEDDKQRVLFRVWVEIFLSCAGTANLNIKRI